MTNKHGGAHRAKMERRKPLMNRMIPPTTHAVRQWVEHLLHSMNVDWTDENFTETPERVAKAWVDTWCSGYGLEPKQVLTVFPNERAERDLVVIKDIPLYSMCSHHLAPFMGKAALAYLPKDHVVGCNQKTSRIYTADIRYVS